MDYLQSRHEMARFSVKKNLNVVRYKFCLVLNGLISTFKAIVGTLTFQISFVLNYKLLTLNF